MQMRGTFFLVSAFAMGLLLFMKALLVFPQRHFGQTRHKGKQTKKDFLRYTGAN